jgi:hypothetical protein
LLAKFLQFFEKLVAVHGFFIGLFCPNVKAKLSEIKNVATRRYGCQAIPR